MVREGGGEPYRWILRLPPPSQHGEGRRLNGDQEGWRGVAATHEESVFLVSLPLLESVKHGPNNYKDTPNPKGRPFLKIIQERDLAAGVYLSEAPSTSEKVRGALVHKRGRKYQHD